MAFPKESELNKIRKKLEKAEGTLMMPENPTTLEKFRWDLCQKFVKYKHDHDLTLEQMGKIMGIDKGKVSKILRHRIEDFSTDRLIVYLEALYPETKLKVG
ncbi:MAG: XRE family transcriptional regulator [Xanthomonadaceae bacterium]|nr:XRE family transcriptional regulator [Xanthomonadaceae bacterium]